VKKLLICRRNKTESVTVATVQRYTIVTASLKWQSIERGRRPVLHSLCIQGVINRTQNVEKSS